MVPAVKGAASMMAARVDQIIATLEIRECISRGGVDRAGQCRVDGQQRARFIRVERDVSIKPLRPGSLQIDAESQIQRYFPADLVGVTYIEGLVKVLIGCSCRFDEAAVVVVAVSEQEGS